MATFREYNSQSPYAAIPSLRLGDSAHIHGDTFETPLLKDGATLATDGYGLRTFTGTFYWKKDTVSPNLALSWMPFRSGQELFSSTKLYVSKSSRRFVSGNMIEVDIEAIGIDYDEIGQNVTLPCTEGAGSAAATPIELHPRFEREIGGTYKERKNGAIFDPLTKKFTGFSTDTTGSQVTSLGNPLAGVRTYFEPRRVIRGFVHADFSNETITQVPQQIGLRTVDGQVSGIKLIPDWQLPAGTEGQEFLLTSANLEPLANVTTGEVGTPRLVKLTYEFTVSGPRGWHPLIYDSAI